MLLVVGAIAAMTMYVKKSQAHARTPHVGSFENPMYAADAAPAPAVTAEGAYGELQEGGAYSTIAASTGGAATGGYMDVPGQGMHAAGADNSGYGI